MKITGVFITKEKEYPKEIDTSGFDEVIIKTESQHVYQRYLSAAEAKNDIIYVQDDDCILDWRELLKHYDGRLTNGITAHHKAAYEGTGITLVGWGCFFPKVMLGVFPQYIDRWGVDPMLLREADRVFTYLNQPHNTIIMPHEDIRQVERMSHEPLHYAYQRQVLRKLRTIK
jgi:hypothetical protein